MPTKSDIVGRTIGLPRSTSPRSVKLKSLRPFSFSQVAQNHAGSRKPQFFGFRDAIAEIRHSCL